MEVLKIELKQHTPLLHFQHESVGATLRASEVKPGLDRYIRQMEDETIDEKLFDYKLSIRCSRGCNQKREKVKGFPFVLANLGESKTGIRMVDFIFHDTVELLFLFKYSKSKQYVEKYIDSFFAVTNFGNRKDKGFGSFFRTGESIDKRFFEKKLREGCKDSVIFYKKINDSLYKEFKSLESEYKRIKSGIRKEPKLLQYAQRKIKNLGSLWEKGCESFL